MKKLFKLLIILMTFTVTSTAQNVKEAVQNTNQIVEGKKNLERDTKELAALKAKIAIFNTAYSGKDAPETNRLKADIVSDMVREVAQSGEKAQKARRELAQSGAEVRSDRRENRRNREDSKHGRFDGTDDDKDAARDRANTRDDRRDRRDDKRDLEMQPLAL